MVAHSHVLGGIEKHVSGLARELIRLGHAVAYAGPSDGWLGEQMRAIGCDCVDLAMHGMYDPISAWKLRRFARKWRADIIHGHAQRGTRYARLAARGICPIIATAHATTAWNWFGRDHVVIAVSAAVRDVLLARGFSPERVRVVHSGTEDPGPMVAPQPGPITTERPLKLGILGRVERVKGHDIALRAIGTLVADFPLQLAIIGADGTDWAAQMKALTQELALGDIVEFWGQRSDVQAVFQQMDVMLLPSRREAFSLSLLESTAAGRPTIGSNLGGNPEVIADGTSGLLVEPENPVALAHAISQLGHDDALRTRMGQAARAIFEKCFSLERMVQNTELQYRQLLGS